MTPPVAPEAVEAAQAKAREIDLRFNPYNLKSQRGYRGPAHRDRIEPILVAALPALREQFLAEIREELLGDAALDAHARALWFGDPNDHALQQSLAGITAALDSLPTPTTEQEEP